MEYLRAGFLWGGVFLILHSGWAFLVSQRLGQPLVDFLLQIHFLSNPFTVRAFDMQLAVMLVVLSGVLGLIAGVAFSILSEIISGSRSSLKRDNGG